ncbi:MAG: sugar transferase [bacterium]|jgi:lipopolysaccharide/colanic/teichoic acid biosynthesis glycosyltransferase|nr:sugar transferase [bacterium]
MINNSIKKFFDFGGAIIGLAIFSPLYLPIVLAIKIESKGPVLVKLERVSAGRKIRVYKFRSMIDGAHQMKKDLSHLNERRDGPFFKIKNDPRLTRVGRLIRKFRLDEIPQLYNVLRGELSLVGPRPHEPEEVGRYPEKYRHLPLAKAGVTGFSQVRGASSLPFLKELEIDDYYLKNWSIRLDLKIIAKTLWILFSDPTAV